MRKGVRCRVLERALFAQRCAPRTGEGDHVVWFTAPAADIIAVAVRAQRRVTRRGSRRSGRAGLPAGRMAGMTFQVRRHRQALEARLRRNCTSMEWASPSPGTSLGLRRWRETDRRYPSRVRTRAMPSSSSGPKLATGSIRRRGRPGKRSLPPTRRPGSAAARSRKVARHLRQAGLSGRDIATVLQVSAQRVSQLLKSA